MTRRRSITSSIWPKRAGRRVVDRVRRARLSAGGDLTATEAALVLRAGDWRASSPLTPIGFAPGSRRSHQKAWFEKSFAFASGSGYYDDSATPKQRGHIQPQVDTMLKYIGVATTCTCSAGAHRKPMAIGATTTTYDELGGLEYFAATSKPCSNKGSW